MIPIYRAKKIDSEEYVIGHFSKDCNDGYYIMNSSECYYEKFDTVDGTYNGITCSNSYEIDPSTLAIHFDDSINTNSEKVWYNLKEISNIVKDYENGKMENS